MQGMKRTVFPLLLLAALAAACAGDGTVIDDADEESTVLVVNDSDFGLTEIYVTDAGSPDWGPNYLAGDVLFPAEEILLTGIACDIYDVLIVAEDGVQCELRDIELCFDDATWTISNDTCADFFRKALAL
jgi:hypothetical protein